MTANRNAVCCAGLAIVLGLLPVALWGQQPPQFAGVTTRTYDSGAIAPGYVFIASCGLQGDHGPYYLQIMGNDGTPYASKKAGYLAPGDDFYPYDFKVLPNGLLLNAQYTGWFNYTEGGTVINQVLDENLNVLESIQMGNGYQAECHDFELLPNGHVLLLGYYTTLADIRSARPAAYPRAEVSGAVLQELDANRRVVWQWRTWDHFDWTQFSDWGPRSSDSLVAGWHVDAVRLDPIDGNLLLATTGEQMKINRQTGDVLWRLGGAHNQFTFAGVDPQEAIRQLAGHDFHRLPNGNYILLNNGAADGSRTSQVHEYQLDEARKVATHVWQYVPPANIATWTRGNVQRLPNGNTFIGWGTSNDGQNPDCTEVTSDGRKVFELSFTNALTDSYRAFRFPFPSDSQQIWGFELELADGNTYRFQETGVTLEVNERIGDGYNSATIQRQPYAPLYPRFEDRAPRLLPVRVLFSETGILSMSGQLSFDAAGFAIPNPGETTVYYRPTAGQGTFVPLNTQYNWVTGQLVAELMGTGFGEFVFGFPDIAEIAFPPLLIEPESLQSTGAVTRVPPLAQSGRTYTVNQELPIALSWCPKGFASGYALQISRDQGFSAPDVDLAGLFEARYTFSNALPNTTYYWRVNTANYGGTSDWSTNVFSTVLPGINVTAPKGGENWLRGMPYFIEWDDNIPEDVSLELYDGNAMVAALAPSIPSTTSYRWPISLNLPPGRNYFIRIRSVVNPGLFGYSEKPFSIIDQPVIQAGSVNRLHDGSVQFTYTAPGATRVAVLTSSDLVNWQPLEVLTLTTDEGTYRDDSAAGTAARFYRLQVPTN